MRRKEQNMKRTHGSEKKEKGDNQRKEHLVYFFA
jgi:hypothetical protein